MSVKDSVTSPSLKDDGRSKHIDRPSLSLFSQSGNIQNGGEQQQQQCVCVRVIEALWACTTLRAPFSSPFFELRWRPFQIDKKICSLRAKKRDLEVRTKYVYKKSQLYLLGTQ